MRIALREVVRSRLRFALLGGAVGLLVFLILFQQVLLGSLLQSFTGAIERQSGDVLVYAEEARRNVSGSVIPPPVLDQVAGVPGVADSAPLGQTTLTVQAGDELADATVFGFTPGSPGTPTEMVSGSMPEAPGEALASSEDAADGFDLGDVVTLEPGGSQLTIVGLTEQSRFSVAPTLWVDWDTYDAAVRAANPDATTVFASLVAVVGEPGVSDDELAAAITEQVDGVEGLTRATAVAEAPGVSEVRSSFLVILALAYVVVGLVLAFFFLILTVQKAPSIALLRALGTPLSRLVAGLYLQVALVVGVGAAVGTALLTLAARGVSDALPLSIDPLATAGALGLVVVVSLVGSLLALRRLVRIDPTGAVNRASLGGLA